MRDYDKSINELIEIVREKFGDELAELLYRISVSVLVK